MYIDFENGEYPDLDMTRLFELPECAVRCENEEETKAVIFSLYHSDKDKIIHLLKGNGDCTPIWKEDAPCLNLYDVDGSHSLGRLRRWPEEDFIRVGFEVIPFEELIVSPIQESDAPIEMLYG